MVTIYQIRHLTDITAFCTFFYKTDKMASITGKMFYLHFIQRIQIQNTREYLQAFLLTETLRH